ncbi:MAG: flagellin [Acidobacteriaceae bacterium]|nr:flagellin [Acidobacteriaceae bacterium]
MALTILNNISALNAENSLSSTQANLQKTLTQLSTGLKINSGSDDAAGLSIANGMQANIAALTQSQQNASNGVGMLQTADGALSQVTTLLNRAVTLATEASSDNLTTGAGSQADALNTEFTSIMSEIDQIGASTNFNGQAVFSATDPTTNTVFISDGTTSGTANTTIATTINALSSKALGLDKSDLSNTADAQTALSLVNTAVNTISAQRGVIGASANRLQAASTVMSAQVQNLTSASNSIQDADIGKTVASMTQYNILQSTGMASLQQANQAQQAVLKLLQ